MSGNTIPTLMVMSVYIFSAILSYNVTQVAGSIKYCMLGKLIINNVLSNLYLMLMVTISIAIMTFNVLQST